MEDELAIAGRCIDALLQVFEAKPFALQVAYSLNKVWIDKHSFE